MAAFKLDENLPAEAAELLRTAGHDALTVVDQDLAGEPDPRVSAVCLAESRIIITLDLDFADIRSYPPDEFAGIIVLSPHAEDKPSVLGLIKTLLPKLAAEECAAQLWIVDESRIRIRE